MDLGIGGLGEGTKVGAGASAIVYRAIQVDLDREVAVKVFTATDDMFVHRFQQEAKTLGRLSLHGGIVTVYDSGINRSGQPYLILEFCQESLRDQLGRSGPFTTVDACRVMAGVADAVAFAHKNGVAHRNIRPENLLRTPSGTVLVSDFGLLSEPGESPTGDIDGGAAADVYALGGTLRDLLADRASATDQPDTVTDDVWGIVQQARATDPADRPTAAELAQRLQAVVDGKPLDPVETVLVAVESAASTTAGAGELTMDLDAGALIAPPRPPTRTTTVPAPLRSAEPPSEPSGERRPPERDTPTIRLLGFEVDRRVLFYGFAAVLVGFVATATAVLVLNRSDDPGTKIAAEDGAEDDPVGPDDGGTSTDLQPPAGPGSRPGSPQSGLYDPAGPPELRPNLDSAARRVTVPDVSGETESKARSALADAGLRVNVVYRETSAVAVGRVVEQDPATGVDVFDDSLVTIFVSRVIEAPPEPVPAVAGLAVATAIKTLRAEGLSLSRQLEIYHDTVPAGAVVGTDPSAGKLVNANSSVTLFVSLGKPAVPVLTGVTAEQAVAKLEELTLVAELVAGPGTNAIGTVERTTPAAGAAVATGSTVQVVVVTASSPSATTTIPVDGSTTLTTEPEPELAPETELVVVPNVLGKAPGVAEAELRAEGFVVTLVEVPVPPDHPAVGVIGAQSLAGLVPAGSTVRIDLGIVILPITTLPTSSPPTTTPTTSTPPTSTLPTSTPTTSTPTTSTLPTNSPPTTTPSTSTPTTTDGTESP